MEILLNTAAGVPGLGILCHRRFLFGDISRLRLNPQRRGGSQVVLLEPSRGPAPAFGHFSTPTLQDLACLSLGILVQQTVSMLLDFRPRAVTGDITRPVDVQLATYGRGVLVKGQEPAELLHPATKLCHAACSEGSAQGTLARVMGLDKARQETLRSRDRGSTKGPTTKAGRIESRLGVSTEGLPLLLCATDQHVVFAPSASNSGLPIVTGHAIWRQVAGSGTHHATAVKGFVLLDNMHPKQKMITENLVVKRRLGSLQMLSNQVVNGSPLSAGRARAAIFVHDNTCRELISLEKNVLVGTPVPVTDGSPGPRVAVRKSMVLSQGLHKAGITRVRRGTAPHDRKEPGVKVESQKVAKLTNGLMAEGSTHVIPNSDQQATAVSVRAAARLVPRTVPAETQTDEHLFSLSRVRIRFLPGNHMRSLLFDLVEQFPGMGSALGIKGPQRQRWPWMRMNVLLREVANPGVLPSRGHHSRIQGALLLAGEGPSLSDVATPLRAHSGPETHLGSQGLLASFGTARGLLGLLKDLGLASPTRSAGKASAIPSLDTVGLPTFTLNADQVVASGGRHFSRVKSSAGTHQGSLTWPKFPSFEEQLRDTLGQGTTLFSEPLKIGNAVVAAADRIAMILQATVQVLPPGTTLKARDGVKPSKAAHQLQAVGLVSRSSRSLLLTAMAVLKALGEGFLPLLQVPPILTKTLRAFSPWEGHLLP